jgi:hypothetical protein
MPSTFGEQGRNSGLFYGLVMLAAGWGGAAWSADCGLPVAGAQLGVTRSTWEETSALGRLLVREQGTLRRASVTADGACQGWQWRLALARSTGERAYEGVSNTSAPIQTHSGLAITDASAQGWTPAWSGWSGGLRLTHRRIDRDIASTGTVRGYPERFAYWQAATGIRQVWALTPTLVLSGDGWLGGGPAGTMALRLPNADATELTLGSSRVAELGLQISSAASAPDQTGWSWHARIDYQWQRMAAGPVKTLMRNGIPVGGAAQPATRQKTAGLGAGVQYRF